MVLTDLLNSEQQEAIKAEGPVIIVAGPGTGKTQTLITKIGYLITEKNRDPSSILALTFTNKAASEIKKRLSSLSVLPNIFTFHGFAYDILLKNKTEEAPLIEILSDEERKALIMTAVQTVTSKIPSDRELKDLSIAFSLEKNNQNNGTSLTKQTYEELKKKNKKYDFEDLLYLLQKKIRALEVPKFDHILVDEFQDTNILQYEIVKSLMSENNIFVIGDPYQSIYKFRGSDGEIFQKFKKDFPHHTEINLTKNYRSNTKIIEASNFLFSDKRNLVAIKNQEEEDTGVFSISTIDEYSEATWIVDKICELVGGTDLIQGSSVVEHEHKSHFSEIAVIYRTHSIRRQIEKKLSLSGIPLQVIGVDSFWEEKEMQFIFSILKYLVEPTPRNYQSIVTSRAIPFSKKVSKLISIELSQTMDISNLAVRIKDICSGNPNDMHILSTINIQIDGLLGKYKTLSIEEVVHMALTLLSFTTEEKRRAFQDDIKHLFSLTYRFVSLKDFINYIDILRDNEYYDPDAERVTLMSIHASKGLEFDHVFIPAFENGAIPYVRETDDILEERNLFYVALTRARKNVFLISPQSRNGKSTTPSLFLKDIEKHILFKKDIQGDLYLKKKEKEKQKKSQLKLF